MEPTVEVSKVITFNNPQAAIKRLAWVATHDKNVVSRSALDTLITLTSMAHPMGADGDIVSATFPKVDLNCLEGRGYIQLTDNGAIHLI